MSTESIVNIIFITIFALCSISMIISTIWFIKRKDKLDREFIKSLRDEISKTNIEE